MTDNQTVAAFLLAYLVIILVCTIAFYVVYAIGLWKMFSKMGEPGWKGLIPFYNEYIQLKHVWSTSVFWVTIAIAVVMGVIQAIAGENPNVFVALIAFVLMIAIVVIDIMFCNKVSKAFGHGTGMTLVLIFFPCIGTMILGFGSSQYIGNPTEQA